MSTNLVVPLRLCDACLHKRHADGGWCYMFKDEPRSVYCAQFVIDPMSKHAMKQQHHSSDGDSRRE